MSVPDIAQRERRAVAGDCYPLQYFLWRGSGRAGSTTAYVTVPFTTSTRPLHCFFFLAFCESDHRRSANTWTSHRR
eukprot:1733743-Rhodomonas_salina.1